jgi:hypothetical protein
MNPLDNRALAEHLVRRSSSGTPAQRASRTERLAQAVHIRAAIESQEHRPLSVPGFRWLQRLAPRRQIGAKFGALTLIVALASIGLLSGFGSRPNPPTARSDWHLTTNELLAVVAQAQSTGANVGKTIVADASIRWTQDTTARPCGRPGPSGSCSSGPCGICSAYVYTGDSTKPPIRVENVPGEAPPCPSVVACRPADPGPGTFALRIKGDGSVTYVGDVELIRNGAWAFDEFAGVLRSIERSQPSSETLYPVLGSIVGASGGPSCAVAPVDARFGCGAPSWLVVNSGGGSIGGDGPAPNGIRVQNELVAASGPGATKTPERATYLLRPVSPMPSDCYVCGDIGTAEIITTLDPIDIPAAPTPAATGSPPEPTSIPDPTAPAGALSVPILTGLQLEQLLGSESVAHANLGRVVIVDAQIAMGLTDCASPPCPNLYTLLAAGIDGRDSNPSIGIDVGQFGAAAVGIASPIAVRIGGAQSVALVAYVHPTTSPLAAGSVSDYKTWAELQRLTQPLAGDPVTVPIAYLVDGWLESQANARACGPGNPSVTAPPRPQDFRCPAWAWLSAAPASLTTDHLVQPPNSVRVQDAAYSDFALDPAASGLPPMVAPRRAIYLVTPTWSGRSPATPGEALAPDAGSVLARVDPIDPASFGPTPAPTPLSNHAETDLGLFRLTLDLPKTMWRSTESITGIARLEYTGTGPSGLSGSNGGPIGFGFAEIGGPRNQSPGYDDACHVQTIGPGFFLSVPLRKDGGYDADSPLASFYSGFFADPLYRLPPGDWEISVWADFETDSTDCGGPEYRMKATIRIHVTP